MTSQEFVYWLNGYLELSGAKKLDAQQVQTIREHIGLVIHKVTKSGSGAPAFFGAAVVPPYQADRLVCANPIGDHIASC